MNTKSILAVAAVAAAFSGMARAGEADLYLSGATQAQSQRVRAEVQAEAVQAAKAVQFGEADPTVGATQAAAGRDAQTVKAEAVQALRQGQYRVGEAG